MLKMSGLPQKIVIGLTGSIGSGKSTILKEFQKQKVKTLSVDQIARQLIKPGSPLEKKIIKIFGEKIISHHGQLDRKKLANLIFQDNCSRKLLNRITHPQIIKILKKKIKQEKSSLIIVEIPLLFEAHLEYLVDKIIVSWLPRSLQLRRLMERDKLTKNEALARIQTQWPLSDKKKKADFLINAGLPLPEVRRQVKKILANFAEGGS